MIASSLAEPLLAADGGDLMETFAAPFPVTVIAELLGVDPERRHDFKRWSDALVRAVFDTPDEQEAQQIGQAAEEMTGYLDEELEKRRRRPENDLLSILMRAEAADGVLSHNEAMNFANTLLVAGSVTTTNLIANATLALLRHPSELAKVCDNPGLIPSMLEETLRYDSPVQVMLRTATRDVEIAGGTLPKESVVLALMGSANRDERVFPQPDRFDVSRNPQGHLAFGQGRHFCLGAALARLQGRIAFETLLPRLSTLTCDEPEVEWISSLSLRGPRRLRVRF